MEMGGASIIPAMSCLWIIVLVDLKNYCLCSPRCKKSSLFDIRDQGCPCMQRLHTSQLTCIPDKVVGEVLSAASILNKPDNRLSEKLELKL